MTPGYTAQRLAHLQEIHQHHFWHVGHRRLIRRLLDERLCVPATVADVGCGPGDMVRWPFGSSIVVVARSIGGARRTTGEAPR